MAITLVLMRHFFDLYMKGSEGALARLFSLGWHGVDLFFVLSGFLIGGQIMEECRAGRFCFKRFFMKRAFRIAPPYLAALVVFVAVFSWANGFFILKDAAVLRDFLAHLFYMQDYIHSDRMMYNGVYWSLAVEEKFYLLLPLLIFFFYLVKREKRCLVVALSALVLLGAALRHISYETGADFWSEFLVPFHSRFDSLLAGVVAAFAFINFRQWLSTGWRHALPPVALACLAPVFAFGGLETGYFTACWQFTLTGVGFSALVLWLVSVDAGRRLPFKKAISSVARYSYTMYLYHILVLWLANPWLKALVAGAGNGTMGALVAFAAYFAAVTAASMAAYAVVDRPFMDWRKKVVERMERGEGRPQAAPVR